MNKFSIYVLLILIYLGLSKSFSPSEQHSPYLIDERVFSNFFQDPPLEVILIDSFQTGFLIKTYFQKFKVFHGFKQPEIRIIRTSHDFWTKNIKNLGMSLYQHLSVDKEWHTAPMPPGVVYIGNPSFGTWELENDGKKYWKFFRAYRHFPEMLSWKSFVPSYHFYEKILIHKKHQKAFYGLHNEFGEKGTITQLTYKNSFDAASKKDKIIAKLHFKKFFKIPKWRQDKKINN